MLQYTVIEVARLTLKLLFVSVSDRRICEKEYGRLFAVESSIWLVYVFADWG
jgi:hypothetical protein